MKRLASCFYPEFGLYVLELVGVFTTSDILKELNKIFLSSDFNPDMNCLIDIRQTCLLFSEKDIRKNRHYFERRFHLDKCRYTAVLGQRPQHTAFGIFFQMYNNSLFYRTDVFNTPEAALRWLNIEIENSHKVINYLHEFDEAYDPGS